MTTQTNPALLRWTELLVHKATVLLAAPLPEDLMLVILERGGASARLSL